MEGDTTTDYEGMLAEIQREVARREQEIYSETVLREARSPSHVGRMPAADARGRVHGWCGDTMEFSLRLVDGTIEEATFFTDGCGATLACGSMLCKMVTGMQLEEAEWVLPEDLVEALNGLPKESMHCAGLAVSTLHNALLNWRVSQMEEREETD